MYMHAQNKAISRDPNAKKKTYYYYYNDYYYYNKGTKNVTTDIK